MTPESVKVGAYHHKGPGEIASPGASQGVFGDQGVVRSGESATSDGPVTWPGRPAVHDATSCCPDNYPQSLRNTHCPQGSSALF